MFSLTATPTKAVQIDHKGTSPFFSNDTPVILFFFLNIYHTFKSSKISFLMTVWLALFKLTAGANNNASTEDFFLKI